MLESTRSTIAWLITLCMTFVCADHVCGESPDFAKDVAPILNKYCVGCHSADEPEADLVLSTFDGLLKGGENGSTIDKNELAKSLLITRVTGAVDPIMPPGRRTSSQQG